jgi:hypothetical protein
MCQPNGRAQPERQTHQALVQHLELRLPRDTFWWHPATGGKRTIITGALMKSLGSKPGLPDIMLIAAGRVYGVELKSERGRLSSVQKDCHEAMRAAGTIIAIAGSLDHALDLLGEWGLL